VPRSEEVRKEIMSEVHRSLYFVHPESSKMYKDLKMTYWWNNIKRESAKYMGQCPTCQQVKAEHQRPVGMLKPLLIPKWKWDEIAMDFILGLPKDTDQRRFHLGISGSFNEKCVLHSCESKGLYGYVGKSIRA